jgi:predicted urease superfamily metal-dependent hydrolase
MLQRRAPEALAALTRALNDPESLVRASAAEALGRIGRPGITPEVLSALMRALDDTEKWVRDHTTDVLGRIGRTLPEVLAALVRRLSNPADGVGDSAGSALRAIGPATTNGEIAILPRQAAQSGERITKVPRALAACTGSLRVFAREPEWIAVTLEDLASSRLRPSALPAAHAS